MDVHEAARLIADGQAVALDVRDPHEWQVGRIGGSLHVPMNELRAAISELPRDKAIVAVCRSGNRSDRVTRELSRHGFQIVNLEGGLKAWARAGLALDPPDGRVA